MKYSALLSVLLPAAVKAAIFSAPCVSFDSKGGGFPVYAGGKAAPILTDPKDSYSVHRAVGDFVKDIKAVTSSTPKATNYTSASSVTKNSTPIIIGTLGSPWIDSIVNATSLDVSNVRGKWEAFTAAQVSNPLPGVSKAYLLVGSDRRGTVYGIYELSEQFGVSPWYWWADVPIQKHSALYALSCSHGSPSVKYRGIFLNDEQPALQSWVNEKYAVNATAQGFNHFFYAQLFELLLRIRVNYLWPAMWAPMFGVDDPLNQATAEYYGIVMGTSHQEPMMRSSPNEFSKFYPGQKWDWTTNKANITQYFTEGTQRAKGRESLYTMGMRGSGDVPLSEETNIALLQDIVATQRQILTTVYNGTDVTTIPQMWCLYKEVQGYFEEGMTVPDDITLLWVDDNWGNVRRYPLASERNRTGGAGVYYHVDYVGGPRDYKWITSSQISKIYDQMSNAYDLGAERIWILNVGDLKPYEMSTEFFISLGWDRSKLNEKNLDAWVAAWATREFNQPSKSNTIAQIVANVTQWNYRRKPELWNTTTYSLIDYREADNSIAAWKATYDASTSIYNSLSSATKAAYFELVHHAVSASYNLAQLYVTVGKNNLYASQARISTNDLADDAEELFEKDYDIGDQYNTMLNGKWSHMMDQTHVGYYYWQQPMTNTMPAINRVQKKFQALPGPMRITIEGLSGAWPGDNPNQCAQGYNCPPPTLRTFDPYQPNPFRWIDISAGGPNSFSWSIASSAPWIKLSATSGSVSRSQPEDRVEVSIDWSKVTNATVAGNVVITAKPTKTCNGCTNSVTVLINAAKTSVGSGFHGFVEGDGGVSIEAPHASSNTTVDGVTWSALPGFGKTVGGIKPLPVTGHGGGSFAIGSGPSISYNFYTFNQVKTLTSYIAPGFNAFGEDRPLKFAVQIDSETPQAIQYVPAVAVAGNLPPQWDGPDGWVANSIITAVTNHSTIAPGAHTLKVWMVEPGVVLEKFVINTGGVRPAYLGPPESKIV